MILVGDVGGTKTLLAVYQRAPGDPQGPLQLVRERRFTSGDHPSFDAIVRDFVAEEPLIAACFGVAGPVVAGRARITHLPWLIDAAELAAALDLQEVVLLNDLQAASLGVLQLPPESRAVIRPGALGGGGTIAVIAPGTGLGEAILYWDGTRYHALATEGGHSDFAPQSDREIRLLRYLRARHGGHISWERALSGDGLGAIYDFLRDLEGLDEPPSLRERLAEGDRNALISQAGLAGESPLAHEALAMFVTLLGAEAGNLALKCYARGGIVIAGGIAPQILSALDDRFVAGLTAKGRFSSFVEGLAVQVALDPRAPLIGAANHIREYA